MPKECLSCGLENTDDAAQCELCGGALSDDPPQAPPAKKAPPKTMLGIAGTAAAEWTAAAGMGTPLQADPPPDASSLIGRVKLVVEQGRIIGEQYLLSEPTMVLGRADPDVQLYPDIDLGGQDNEYVHRQHARLQFFDFASRLSVEHIGGHNQTLVNNRPVETGELVELQPGDRLRVGRVLMRVKMVE